MRSSALALACAAATACVALPPSRTELSSVAHGSATGYRFATGGHSASTPPRLDIPFELGAGYVYERLGDGDGQHGNYIELARRVWQRGRLRAFAAARGEIFWNDVGELGARRGASARLSIERVLGHVAGGAGDRGGGVAAYGLVAPGVYLEAGVRELQHGGATGVVIGGVSLRLPFLFAASRPTILP